MRTLAASVPGGVLEHSARWCFKMRSIHSILCLMTASAVGVTACSDPVPPGSDGSGGTVSTGGAPATGGSPGTGGSVGASGGTTGVGGGAPGTGGIAATGGTGGVDGTGGVGTGGSQPVII